MDKVKPTGVSRKIEDCNCPVCKTPMTEFRTEPITVLDDASYLPTKQKSQCPNCSYWIPYYDGTTREVVNSSES
jgi:hypothetical protein